MNVISKRLMTAVAIAVAVALGTTGTVVPANAAPVSVSTESPKGEDKGTETQGEQVGGKQSKALPVACLFVPWACWAAAGTAVAGIGYGVGQVLQGVASIIRESNSRPQPTKKTNSLGVAPIAIQLGSVTG